MKEFAFFAEKKWDFDLPITGFSTDARTIFPGQVFCALNGAHVDGHDFIEQAFAKGASCALVDKECSSSSPLFRVDSVLETLQKAAKAIIAQNKSKVVAITGSVGKTSTKEILFTLLEKKYVTWKTPGNQNSQVGLPLALLNELTGQESLLVIEMGMSNPGQISKLIQIAPPDIALITQIALVHAANFESLEEILTAKKEIFSHPKTKIKICPYEWGKEITFSLKEQNADYYLADTCWFEKGKRIGELNINKHNSHNIAAAIVIARKLGMTFDEIQERLAFIKPVQQRFEYKEKQGILFIDDSYNASPIAVKAALQHLPKPKKNRFTFAILGSMMELGKFSRQCHIDIAEEALKTVDYLFCYGEECLPMLEVWQNNARQAFYFESQKALADTLKLHVDEGDVVLVKGSFSMQMWKIIEEF